MKNNIKWIVGYVDEYGKINFKVVKMNDKIDNHNQIWPGPKHGKWRWDPTNSNHLNSYGEPLDFDDEERIWKIIDELISF